MFSIIGRDLRGAARLCRDVGLGGFNKAKAAAYAEAASALDLYNVAVGFTGPEMLSLCDDIVGYLEVVIRAEWPAQAEGRMIDRGEVYLQKLNRAAVGFKPTATADGNLHAMLLQSLARLSEARQQRLLAAETTVPTVVWIVTPVGGVLTVAFGSFSAFRASARTWRCRRRWQYPAPWC
jgi:hypothetical protein